MPKKKLSAGTIGTLRHTGGGTATLYWHTGSPGLALAVTAAGKRTWRYRERKRNPRTFVIGEWPTMSLAAACRKADELRNEGTAVDAATATVAQVIDRYLAEHRLKIRKILAGECRLVRSRCEWISQTFGHLRMSTVTTRDVADGFRQLSDRPGAHDQARTIMISVYRWAGLRDHPCRDLRPLQRRYEKRGLEDREIAALIAATRDHHNVTMRTLFLVAYELALRPGELARLHWSDIDWQRRTLTLRAPRTPQEALSGTRVRKTGRDLTADLNDRVVDLLTQLRAITACKQRSEFVFANRHGRPTTSYRKAWHVIRDKAGVPHVRLYDLVRHARATQWLAAGVSIADVSALLDHADVSMTARYLDSSRERRKAAIDIPPPSVRENDPDA